MGFTGESTLPIVVAPSIVQTMIDLATRYPNDIWLTSLRIFGHDNDLLRQTPVGIIYKDAGSIVLTREIGCHDPPNRALGARMRWCGNGDCSTIDAVYFKNKMVGKGVEQLKLKCVGCQFASGWIKVSDVKWAKPVPGNRRASWHEYPLSPNQLFVFGAPKPAAGDLKRKASEDGVERPLKK